jgi:hypothetical protein
MPRRDACESCRSRALLRGPRGHRRPRRDSRGVVVDIGPPDESPDDVEDVDAERSGSGHPELDSPGEWVWPGAQARRRRIGSVIGHAGEIEGVIRIGSRSRGVAAPAGRLKRRLELGLQCGTPMSLPPDLQPHPELPRPRPQPRIVHRDPPRGCRAHVVRTSSTGGRLLGVFRSAS